MSTSFRVSFVGSLRLGLSLAAFVSVMAQTKERTANAETTKSTSSLKATKKKKKSKTVAPAVIVLGAYAQPSIAEPVSTTPVVQTTTAVSPAAPATSTRPSLNM